ncbi:hypothetical protein ACE193_03620 [Bernardetia sp. OM2101]|uniref:hypothetical protein n=1 Tax=Bernardetia sp. OM2101 TaxID=3344876 RepID=UPI0035D00726
MKITLFALLILLLFISCSSEKETQSNTDETQISNIKNQETRNNFVEINQKEVSLQRKEIKKRIEKDSIFIVKFDKINIKFISSDIWSKEDEFEKTYTDSIKINSGLGESFKNKVFEIIQKDSSIVDVEVFESYQTSLGVSEEGAHLDLLNWKHFNSEWQKLIIKNNSFISKEYSEKESKLFPKVNTKQILEAVMVEYGGEENKFTERARNCKNANSYPCSVMINQFNFKIVVTDKNGSKINYFILINLPMGC